MQIIFHRSRSLLPQFLQKNFKINSRYFHIAEFQKLNPPPKKRGGFGRGLSKQVAVCPHVVVLCCDILHECFADKLKNQNKRKPKPRNFQNALRISAHEFLTRVSLKRWGGKMLHEKNAGFCPYMSFLEKLKFQRGDPYKKLISKGGTLKNKFAIDFEQEQRIILHFVINIFCTHA